MEPRIRNAVAWVQASIAATIAVFSGPALTWIQSNLRFGGVAIVALLIATVFVLRAMEFLVIYVLDQSIWIRRVILGGAKYVDDRRAPAPADLLGTEAIFHQVK
jgi:hypothetical protein